MGATKELAGGGYPCVVVGCTNPGRAKTKPSACQACQSRASYHRRNPDAPYHPLGHWGKHKGAVCAIEGCSAAATAKGLCQSHYNKSRWASGYGRRSSAKNRDAHLRHRYGISLDEYMVLLAAQGGCCAVCREPPTSANTRAHWNNKLCVDHCHNSGKVRALLCNDCNLAVGYTKNRRTALAVAEYFRLHPDPDTGHNILGD